MIVHSDCKILPNKYLTDASSNKASVWIIATHSNVPINNRIYLQEEVKKAQNTFVEPYPKPVLVHHQQGDGEPIGRVVYSEYFEVERLEEAKKLTNSEIEMPEDSDGFLLLKAEISDAEAVQKINDGRYKTVSVGFFIDKLTCNICGADITDDYWEEHEHKPGKVYDGKTMYKIPSGLNYIEISYVNVPADQYAKALDENNKLTEEKNNVEQNEKISKDAIDKNMVVNSDQAEIGTTIISVDSTKGGLTVMEPKEIKELMDKVAELEAKVQRANDYIDKIELKEKQDFVEEIIALEEKIEPIADKETERTLLLGKDMEALKREHSILKKAVDKLDSLSKKDEEDKNEKPVEEKTEEELKTESATEDSEEAETKENKTEEDSETKKSTEVSEENKEDSSSETKQTKEDSKPVNPAKGLTEEEEKTQSVVDKYKEIGIL